MPTNESIRCRIAACRESLDDGKEWSFYLINDSGVPLESVVLHSVSHEWGDVGDSRQVDVRIAKLASGAHALLWREDGFGGELRTELSLHVRARGREVSLDFEFPKLYRQRNLSQVTELGKRGFQVTSVR